MNSFVVSCFLLIDYKILLFPLCLSVYLHGLCVKACVCVMYPCMHVCTDVGTWTKVYDGLK